MTSAKPEVAEFKSKSFKIPKRLGAGVDMRLFFKTVEVAFGFKHHRHPIISCVMRWLFIASAINVFHTFFFSCRVYRGQTECLPHATKKGYHLAGEKRRCGFPSAGPTLHFGPRSILSRS